MASRPARLISSFAAFFLAASPLLALDDPPLANWAVPRASGGHHLSTLGDIGGPSTFVSIAPCRIVDTRGGAPLGGGIGPFTSGQTRDYALNAAGAPCNGIPAGVSGYSLNVTATNETGTGYVAIYPTGNPPSPMVSLLNYKAGAAIANATIVPCDASGSITVLNQGATAAVVLDINGYLLGDSARMNANEYLNATGSYDYGGAVLYVRNYTTVAGSSTMSVISNSNDGSAAVEALEYGSGGRTYGVWATNASTNLGAAAVAGFQGGTTANLGGFGAVGVYGSSTNSYGVLGVSYNYGISGILEDPSGAILASGDLGRTHYGVYSSGDFGGTGAKYFVEPHPEDPTKVIKYVALEGPESGTYFRGRGKFVGGVATVDVPESFRMVSDTEGLTVQITPIGRPAAVAVTRMGLDGIEAESTRDVEFSYLVQGVRKAFKDFHEIQTGDEFRPRRPHERMPAYLTEEAKRRLVANGTYNADGTVNMTTAARVGWVDQWRAEEEARRKDAETASREAVARDTQGSGGVRLLH